MLACRRVWALAIFLAFSTSSAPVLINGVFLGTRLYVRRLSCSGASPQGDELRLRGIEQLKFLRLTMRKLKRASSFTDPDRRVDTHALAPSPESYRHRVSASRKAYCQDNNTAQSSYRPRPLQWLPQLQSVCSIEVADPHDPHLPTSQQEKAEKECQLAGKNYRLTQYFDSCGKS